MNAAQRFLIDENYPDKFIKSVNGEDIYVSDLMLKFYRDKLPKGIIDDTLCLDCGESDAIIWTVDHGRCQGCYDKYLIPKSPEPHEPAGA